MSRRNLEIAILNEGELRISKVVMPEAIAPMLPAPPCNIFSITIRHGSILAISWRQPLSADISRSIRLRFAALTHCRAFHQGWLSAMICALSRRKLKMARAAEAIRPSVVVGDASATDECCRTARRILAMILAGFRESQWALLPMTGAPLHRWRDESRRHARAKRRATPGSILSVRESMMMAARPARRIRPSAWARDPRQQSYAPEAREMASSQLCSAS